MLIKFTTRTGASSIPYHSAVHLTTRCVLESDRLLFLFSNVIRLFDTTERRNLCKTRISLAFSRSTEFLKYIALLTDTLTKAMNSSRFTSRNINVVRDLGHSWSALRISSTPWSPFFFHRIDVEGVFQDIHHHDPCSKRYQSDDDRVSERFCDDLKCFRSTRRHFAILTGITVTEALADIVTEH